MTCNCNSRLDAVLESLQDIKTELGQVKGKCQQIEKELFGISNAASEEKDLVAVMETTTVRQILEKLEFDLEWVKRDRYEAKKREDEEARRREEEANRNVEEARRSEVEAKRMKEETKWREAAKAKCQQEEANKRRGEKEEGKRLENDKANLRPKKQFNGNRNRSQNVGPRFQDPRNNLSNNDFRDDMGFFSSIAPLVPAAKSRQGPVSPFRGYSYFNSAPPVRRPQREPALPRQVSPPDSPEPDSSDPFGTTNCPACSWNNPSRRIVCIKCRSRLRPIATKSSACSTLFDFDEAEEDDWW